MPTMSPSQARAFQQAAARFNVYILVRETNLASLDHVGKGYAEPKRLDCKAKTADSNWQSPFGEKQSAGLVTDPEVVGQGAYRLRKYAEALAEWAGFARTYLRPEVRTLEGQRRLTYVPNGGLYFVDLDPASPRYGCLKFTSSSLMSAGKYIHGDFDLYGIVPAGDPARNVRVAETMLDDYAARQARGPGEAPPTNHFRSPELRDVQYFLNRQLGVPMVLHGAQEGYKGEHTDETIDVFHPDGQMTRAEGAAGIAALYQTLFKGRKLFTKGGPTVTVRGGYHMPG